MSQALKFLNKAREIESSLAASFLFVSESRLSLNAEVEESTAEEDMKDHVDLKFKIEIKIDVKGRKKLNRKDDQFSYEFTYVEILNVNGDRGWLYGDADYFAFEDEAVFWMISKKTLIYLVEKNTIKKFTTEPTEWHCYKRPDRSKEATVLVPFDLIRAQSELTIPKIKNIIRPQNA